MSGPFKVAALPLIREAARWHDENPALREVRTPLWKNDFEAGALWMRRCLGLLRGRPLAGAGGRFNRLGLMKYGWAGLGAALTAALVPIPYFFLAPLVVLIFYGVEVQMVFLFPLALDGSDHPFRDSGRLVKANGGTPQALRIVLPVALFMLLGGFIGQGFARSWRIGCLAILVWYERAKTHELAA